MKVKINGILRFADAVKSRSFDIFRDVNQESLDFLFVTIAYYNIPVEDAYERFTYVTLRDITSDD